LKDWKNHITEKKLVMRIQRNEEKKPHPNQYKEPHFTCEIHYGPDSDKYIREYQQMKTASFREQLEKSNRQELLYIKEMLEEYRKTILK
jgi:hypothetical protein